MRLQLTVAASSMSLLFASCFANGGEPHGQAPAPSAPVAPIAAPPAPPPSVPLPPLSPGARTEDERNTIDVFRAVAPSTVFVTNNQILVDRWSMRALEAPAGSGTGFTWDALGNVVTNFHVVNGGRSWTVTLQDGSEWPARLVGGDPRKDVAVLHIDAPRDRLVPIVVSPPDAAIEVGQKTLAIGNPFGLDHTLTTGVVSALGREVVGFGGVTIKGMIQTDASINPGNSGGPLLDSQGRLIGMNTMIFSAAGQSAGIGFAVPAPTVKRVVDQILATGHVERVGLGISLVDDRIARRSGVVGLVVREVRKGGPADKAGLRGLVATPRGVAIGDVIVAIDGKPVRGFDDYYSALDGRPVGTPARVSVMRDGRSFDVDIALIVDDEG